MKDVEKELNSLISFKSIIEAYEEIASIRMRRIKASVLHNRVYLEGLRRAFFHIKYSYESEIEKLRKKKKSVRNIRTTNGKTVSVLLTANTGLYGDILLKTFNFFKKHIVEEETDIVIIGRIGMRFYEAAGFGKNVKFYDISDSGLDKEDMNQLLEELVQYERVIVYHGEFKDILVQNPIAVSISGDLISESTDMVEDKSARYIFEPSLEEIMSYFEEKIIAALFEHTIFESNLSKYASRMISLNQATVKIEKEISNMSLETKRVKHRVQNSKQLNILSSLVGRF